MTRTLAQLGHDERREIVQAIHREAESSGWSNLTNAQKSSLYRRWESTYDLTHATLKDSVMKGFDVAQEVPRKGEAKIRQELLELFQSCDIFVEAECKMWSGRERADFVLGFHRQFVTHVVEVERADSWSEGLRQVLWYRAGFHQSTQRHVQPMLILFGNVSRERFDQIVATCDNNHVFLVTYKLKVDGALETCRAVQGLIRLPSAP